MARVILEPIGQAIESSIGTTEYQNQVGSMQPLESQLADRRRQLAQGWGEEYIERVHKKGKLTAWERIERLKDPGSALYPLNSFVNWGLDFGGRPSPGAGVITAFVRVHGKYCVVIANDNTVASGSWWPMTPEKIQRAQKIALQLRLPVVYFVDSSGLYLPEQGRTFPGPTGAGHIFKMNSLLSDAGVPQVAGVMGDCIAGGGYMPIISDKVFMTEQAYMVIAGAALIKGAKTQNITSLSIGGADVHVHISRCADVRVPNDETLVDKVRDEIKSLPSSAADYYRFGMSPAEPRFEPHELVGLLPKDHRIAYDMRDVLARLTDDSLFWELAPDIGEEMIVGIARIGGLYTGIIANNVQLTKHPEKPKQSRPGSSLYRDGIAKIAAFSRLCNDDGIPICWLQDIAGFDIGVEAEAQGLLGYGSSLIYTNSTNQTPMITVLLRKCSGAGYYAMSGMPYDPVLQISTPITRLAVMEGRTLAIGAYRTKLDDNFQIQASSDEERLKIEQGMKKVEDRISSDMDPYRSASQMDTDEIVCLSELRDYLKAMIEMCYQSHGYRRVKNPRIWSVHDLSAMLR